MNLEYVRDEDLKVGDVVILWATEERIITRIDPYRGPLSGCLGLATTNVGSGFSLWVGQTTKVVKR